jgi:hypothetical protein
MDKSDKSIEHLQVDVDWNRPELQELLAKIEGLRLDNRGMFKPRPIVIRSFWPQAELLGSGTLTANDGKGNWVVKTDFPLEVGTGLTVGQEIAELDTVVHYVCEVRACRRGMRTEDADQPVFLSTLYCQRRKP